MNSVSYRLVMARPNVGFDYFFSWTNNTPREALIMWRQEWERIKDLSDAKQLQERYRIEVSLGGQIHSVGISSHWATNDYIQTHENHRNWYAWVQGQEK